MDKKHIQLNLKNKIHSKETNYIMRTRKQSENEGKTYYSFLDFKIIQKLVTNTNI